MVATLVLGAFVGLAMGLTGAGGGILAVPLLVFGLHLTVAEAGPISLLAVGTAAAFDAFMGLRAGIVRYRAAVLIACSGIASAPAGVWLAQRLDTRLMGMLFAAVLAWIAWHTFRESDVAQPGRGAQALALRCLRSHEGGRFIWTGRCATALSISGGIAGLLSGLLGVGGGFVMVPALQRHTDLEAKSVVATSLAVISMVSLSGFAVSMWSGQVNPGLALPFAAAGMAGVWIGSRLTSRLPPRYLKRTFASICILVALGMVLISV